MATSFSLAVLRRCAPHRPTSYLVANLARHARPITNPNTTAINEHNNNNNNSKIRRVHSSAERAVQTITPKRDPPLCGRGGFSRTAISAATAPQYARSFSPSTCSLTKAATPPIHQGLRKQYSTSNTSSIYMGEYDTCEFYNSGSSILLELDCGNGRMQLGFAHDATAGDLINKLRKITGMYCALKKGRGSLIPPAAELRFCLDPGVILLLGTSEYVFLSGNVKEISNKEQDTFANAIRKTADEKYSNKLARMISFFMQYLDNRFYSKHPFPTYPQTSNKIENGVYPLANTLPWIDQPTTTTTTTTTTAAAAAAYDGIRVALVSDWATGSREAFYTAKCIEARQPHYTIHMGGIYHAGTEEQVRNNCLGQGHNNVSWPHGSLGSFALNGHREMATRGFGYFDHFLPTLGIRAPAGVAPAQAPPSSSSTSESQLRANVLTGQKASYFCLENDYWRVIGLDTGYNAFSGTCEQPSEVVDWLANVLQLGGAQDDNRGIIILTHHPYYTAFQGLGPVQTMFSSGLRNSEDSDASATARQLSAVIKKGLLQRQRSRPARNVLWFWGKERKFTWYGLNSNTGATAEQTAEVNEPSPLDQLFAYGRCVGNGGYEEESMTRIAKDALRTNLRYFDNRVITKDMGTHDAITGLNGYVQCTFDKNRLKVEYVSVNPLLWSPSLGPASVEKTVVTERWSIEPSAEGAVLVLNEFDVHDNQITKVYENSLLPHNKHYMLDTFSAAAAETATATTHK